MARESTESKSILEQKRIKQQMISISRFFLGDWYQKLSGLNNGPAILEMLDMEVWGDVEGI